MNIDQARGTVMQAAGRLQLKFGQVIGSTHHQRRGRMKELHGRTRKDIGGVDELLRGLHRKP